MRLQRRHKWVLVAAVAAGAAVAVATTAPKPAPVPVSAVCHARGALPDPVCTPGVADPRVTQANIQQTICVSGYTATVRPPVSVTAPEKITSEHQYGYPNGSQGEYDHLIPLELGGSNDTKNLWFEAGSIPNPKDKVENRLKAEVCAGSLTLAQAQAEIATNWQTAK